MARNLILLAAVAAVTTAREPSREVFVVVTPAQGGQGDRVVLPPGTTAFETAAAYCRDKDIGQAYSRDGLDPMKDSVCTIPLVTELRQEAALQCASDVKPAISFTINVDRNGERNAEEFRICSGGTVEDAAVQFCVAKVSEEDVLACIDTLATEANRLIQSSAPSSDDSQTPAAPTGDITGNEAGMGAQSAYVGQSLKADSDSSPNANSARAPGDAPAASPPEPVKPDSRRNKKTPPRATFRKLAPGEKLGPSWMGILGFVALLLVWRWAENSYYARNAKSKASEDSKKASEGGGSKKASKKKQQNKHKNKGTAGGLGSSKTTEKSGDSIATSAPDVISGESALEPEQTLDEKTEAEDETSEISTLEASLPETVVSSTPVNNKVNEVLVAPNFSRHIEPDAEANFKLNSEPEDSPGTTKSNSSEQSDELYPDSHTDLSAVTAPMVVLAPAPSETGQEIIAQAAVEDTAVLTEVPETSKSRRNGVEASPKDDDEDDGDEDEEEEGPSHAPVAAPVPAAAAGVDEAAAAAAKGGVEARAEGSEEVESVDSGAETVEPSPEAKEQTKVAGYVAHTVEDTTIPLARDTQDEVGDALDEGQPQATRANLENNSKVPRVSKEVESARAFVITSTLSDEASDKEGSDEQEDEHAPSPPTAGQNAGRVQALEQEIADLIATLQATQARAEVDAAAARHWKARALAAAESGRSTATTSSIAKNNNSSSSYSSSSKPLAAQASNGKKASPSSRNKKPVVAQKDKEKSAPASKDAVPAPAAPAPAAPPMPKAPEEQASEAAPSLPPQTISEASQPQDAAKDSASVAQNVATALAAGAAAAGASPAEAAAVAEELSAGP